MHGHGRAIRIGIGLLCAVLALAGCGLFSERASYRVRMTVEMQTPQGLRSGSSVMQVNASKNVALTAHEHPGSAGLQGQAVIVERPDGPVFVLLTTPDAGPLLATQLTKALDPSTDSMDARAFVTTVRRLGEAPFGTKADLPRADWPMMVQFGDVRDPTSVEHVDPDAVGIRRIRLESTDATLTTGIEKRLRWLKDVRGGYLHGKSTSRGAPLGLFGLQFSTEIGNE